MSDQSRIQWTDATWNPVTGCTKASPGCANCYAERMAGRLQAMGADKYRDGFAPTCHPDALNEPMRWKKPRRVFVCSMGDLFHQTVSAEFLERVWRVMAACPQHTFQILTKRAARMRMTLEHEALGWTTRLRRLDPDMPWPLPNVWLGVTAEDQERADERIPQLLATPAAVRFVSVEPMLGPVDLSRIGRCQGAPMSALKENVGHCDRPRLDWVIAGCESGPKRRDAAPNWFRSLRDQCQDAGVPFFLKQAAIPVGGPIVKMPPLDGVVWDQMPEPVQ